MTVDEHLPARLAEPRDIRPGILANYPPVCGPSSTDAATSGCGPLFTTNIIDVTGSAGPVLRRISSTVVTIIGAAAMTDW